jgi:hypothetical protein
MGECKQIGRVRVNYFVGTTQGVPMDGVRVKSNARKNGSGVTCAARSILLLVPPLAKGTAAAIFVERDEEDAVEFSAEAGWNNNEGSPPASDSLIKSYGEDFVSKLNVLLGVGDVGPVFEDGLLSAHGFDERGDLIGAVFREELRRGVRIAAFPRVAVSIQPGGEGMWGHAHVTARGYTKKVG